MREAPSLEIIDALTQLGATVRAYDPVAMEEAQRILGDKIQYAKDEYDAVIEADGLIVVTEWSEFRMPNYRILEKLMNQKTIFDGRNVYDLEEMRDLGFNYYSIGREVVRQHEEESVGA